VKCTAANGADGRLANSISAVNATNLSDGLGASGHLDTRIDRLARSIGDLQDIVGAVKAKGASLRAIEQPIGTSTAAASVPRHARGVR
jgi:hypothetical protein